MVRELQPWHVNIDKRQIKRPKIYIRDSGILHYLLGLNSSSSILTHPKLGASWEGFALEQLTTHLDLEPEEVFFWGTHAEAELDLYTVISGKKIGFEFKYTDSPKITKSMKHAINDLKLNHLYLIYPGPHSFKLREDISVISFKELKKFSP